MIAFKPRFVCGALAVASALACGRGGMTVRQVADAQELYPTKGGPPPPPPSDAGSADNQADAAENVCLISPPLTFGPEGGDPLYQDRFTLDGDVLTVTRTYYGPTDGPTVRSCSPSLRACGTWGVVTISTIAKDLADAKVQAAFALTRPQLYGHDGLDNDGIIWSISRADGGGFLVGSQCYSPPEDPCQSIPQAIQNLVDDLRNLADAGVAAPECAGP